MDILLKAIQQELRTGLATVRDRDIYITPHLGFVPPGVKQPCVGIKDGKVTHRYGMAESKGYTLVVHFAILIDPKKKESSIVGEGDGILALQKKCVDLLEFNNLGVSGLSGAAVVADLETEYFESKTESNLLRKRFSLQYEKGR